MHSIAEIAGRIAARLSDGGRLTLLTGAGISAESGVPTFRDIGGLWQRYSVDELASPEGFRRNPGLVFEFYNVRRAQLRHVNPNAGHLALAELEQLIDSRCTLITQNVDDLHERAGSRCVLHMHGEIRKARCTVCEQVQPWLVDLDADSACRACGRQKLRPHVVWFGEVPLHLDREIPAGLDTEVFMSIGTSGQVYPAAGFAAEAARHGALTVEVNPQDTAHADVFDARLRGPAGELLPQLIGYLRECLGAGAEVSATGRPRT